MAERTVLVSDLSGVEGDVTQVIYSFEGKDWVIDLTLEERATLAELLEPYIKVSRRPKPKGSTDTKSKGSASKGEAAVIREWAISQGIEVSERGRVSKEVREEYAKAMKG